MKLWLAFVAITASTCAQNIAFSNGSEVITFGTVGIPLPVIRVDLQDASGTAGHGVLIEATSVPACKLVGSLVQVIDGAAVFASLIFTAHVADPVLSFRVVASPSAPVISTRIRLLPAVMDAYAIRFLVPPPQTVQHGASFSVVIETVTSAHQPTMTPTGGTVTATSTYTLSGAASAFIAGEASFVLSVDEYTEQPVALTFTVQDPSQPQLHGKKLVSTIRLTVNTKDRLAFDAASPWKVAGDVIPVSHGVVISPPTVVAVLTSSGAVSTAVNGIVTATGTSSAGLPVELLGATANVVNGKAAFPSLKVTGFYEGLREVRLAFVFEALPELSTGFNPLTVGAFGLRFLPTNPVFSAEGQTASVTLGAALPPFAVQVVDSNGNIDTTASGLIIDALLNGSTVLRSVPVVAGSAAFTGLVLGSTSSNAYLTFKVRSPSISSVVVSRGVELTTGRITVHAVAGYIAFGGFATGSSMTAAGQTLTVNQQGVIPDIKVVLYDSSGAVDTVTVASVVVTSTSGTLRSPGGSRVQFTSGVATFAGLLFEDVPTDAKLVFTLSAAGTSISTGTVTVRGKPHHLARYVPYPTGAVLGVQTEMLIAVVDENGTPVDGLAYTAPTLKLGGAGVTPGAWNPVMIAPVRFVLGPPLTPGDTAKLTVTAAGSTPIPLTLEVQLSVSNVTNNADHSSFLDPYSVPTVARLREKQSVRVAVLDASSLPAVDTDAAYVVVSEMTGGSSGVTMLPYNRMVAGVQTVEFEFTGPVRDATAVFSTVLPGSNIPDLSRLYRLLPGTSHSISVTDITNKLAGSSAYPTVAAGSIVTVSYQIFDMDGNKVSESPAVSATGEGVTLVQSSPGAGMGSVTIKFEGAVSSNRAVLLETTAPSMQVAQLFTVVAGTAHHIAVEMPSTAVLGGGVPAVVTVFDEYGNLARGADSTAVLVTSQQHTLAVEAPFSTTSPSVMTARFSLQGPAGPATVNFTPSLQGTTFSPTSVVMNIALIGPQYGLQFDKVFGPVHSEGMPLAVTMGKVIAPPITVNVVDSRGELDTQSSHVFIRASVQGATGQVLVNTDASVVSGRAVFSSLMFTRPVDPMSQITFTAVQNPQSAAAEVAGKAIVTGNVMLTLKASGLGFRSTDSVFHYEGQTLTATVQVPMGRVAVVVTTSDGAVDTSVGGSVVVTATPTQGTLSGASVPVVNGVATFDRLAFTSYAVQPIITFAIAGVDASLPVYGKSVTTGVIEVLQPPQYLKITADPLVPSAQDPGYLVYGVTNTVPVDVYNMQGALAAPPSGMTVRAASDKATAGAEPASGNSRFSITLQPFAVGQAEVVLTPWAAFVQFSPLSVARTYVICAGEVAGMVFDESTPYELEQGISTAVTLHAVDSGGNRLASTWSPGCREAYKYTGTGPPYATDIASTVSGNGLRLGNASYNENGTVTVPLYAEQILQETVATFHFNSANVQSVNRTFSIAPAVPSVLYIDPSYTSAQSGGSIPYAVEVRSKGGQVVTSADDTNIAVNGTGAAVASQGPLSGGKAAYVLKVTGPPRIQVISFTPSRPGTAYASRTDVQVNVTYATHSGGVFHTQWYQLFPNFPFATNTDFATALSKRLTALSAGPQYCPMTEVCRELREGNVRVIPVEQWPVPPLGNATPANSLPSARGYVVQLVNVEQTQMPRIEAALSNANVPSLNLFPELEHSGAPVKFLGYNVFDTPSGVPCSSIGNETTCVANSCTWNAPGCVQTCAVAGTEAACGLLSHCAWNKMGSYCYVARSPDGGFLSDPFGQDWWVLLLLGVLLLLLCCACAFGYRQLVAKDGQADEAKTDVTQDRTDDREPVSDDHSVQRSDSVVVVPEEPVRDNPLERFGEMQGHGYDMHSEGEVQACVSLSSAPYEHEEPPRRELTERERIEEAIKQVDGMIQYLDTKEESRAARWEGPSYVMAEAYSPYPLPGYEERYRRGEVASPFQSSVPREASQHLESLKSYVDVEEAEDVLVETGSALTVDGDGNVVQRSARYVPRQRQSVR